VGEWPEVPFAEAIDFQEGPGIMAADFRDQGVPLIRLAGLERGGTVLAGCNFLDPSTVQRRWAHFALREGDILLSSSASLGRIAVVGAEAEGAIPYTGIIRMRPRDERVHAPFIRYLLEAPDFQRQAEIAGVGSVMRHFGPMHLRQMTVSLPPAETQRRITEILGALDDKIELTRRTSGTLEATARALFEFSFTAGTATQADGWRPSVISQEFEVTMGQSPPGSTYNSTGDGLPFYQGRADFGTRFPARRVYCTAPTRIARAGDTLLSVRAPVGDINIATEACAIGRGVAAVRHRSGGRTYTFEFMGSIRAVLDEYNGHGTVFGAIGGKELSAIPCLAPPDGLVSRFDEQARPLDERLENLERQRQTLTEIRDAMLPRLLSGEMSRSFGRGQVA